MNMRTHAAPKGFTLLELVIVIGLILLLLGLGLAFTMTTLRSAFLETAASAVAADLRQAQADALSQAGGDRGVAAFADRSVRFVGASYAARDPAQDSVTPFPAPVTVSGDAEFVFAEGTIAPDAPGTLTLSHGSRFADLTLNAYGSLEISWRRD